jgi:hypothetical protein
MIHQPIIDLYKSVVRRSKIDGPHEDLGYRRSLLKNLQGLGLIGEKRHGNTIGLNRRIIIEGILDKLYGNM